MTDQSYNEMGAGTLLAHMGTDAEKWTDAFLHMTGLNTVDIPLDDFRDTVRGWFANALKSGEGKGWSRAHEEDPGINGLAALANKTAHEKGWWQSSRSFGEVIALIHSEASEALEEWRDGHAVDERYYTVAKYRPAPETFPRIKEGFEDTLKLEELYDYASSFDRRGDGATVMPDEIPEAVARDLVLLGFLKPEGVPAELADIFIRVGDATDQYGIDLMEEVRLKSAYNSTRPFKHGGKIA
jgi:hypothetical protein